MSESGRRPGQKVARPGDAPKLAPGLLEFLRAALRSLPRGSAILADYRDLCCHVAEQALGQFGPLARDVFGRWAIDGPASLHRALTQFLARFRPSAYRKLARGAGSEAAAAFLPIFDPEAGLRRARQEVLEAPAAPPPEDRADGPPGIGPLLGVALVEMKGLRLHVEIHATLDGEGLCLIVRRPPEQE